MLGDGEDCVLSQMEHGSRESRFLDVCLVVVQSYHFSLLALSFW